MIRGNSSIKDPYNEVAGVVIQKYLYFNYHSGLDPESSVFGLDSRLRGNDGFGVYVKKC